jgi:biotin carboxyl carrier protein
MPYITTINHHTYTITAEENGQPRHITLDGQTLDVDWQQIATLADQGGRYSLLIAGRTYEVHARRILKAGEQTGQTYEVLLLGQRFEVQVEDERTKMLAGLAGGSAQSGEASIQAPMPGLVVGIPVEEGMQVEQGQTVAVLEAMKMENDLPSPMSGRIKAIHVSKGQTVDLGQTLVVIESML